MSKLRVGAILFNGFELLDVFGPLEMYGLAKEDFDISIISFEKDGVKSAQGPVITPDEYPIKQKQCDILLVPGGMGTRTEIENTALLDWLSLQASHATYVSSVCTGSALLAKAGLLNGLKATTNKIAFSWVESVGSKDIMWQKKARWVEDGKYITSSGISAGIDMTLAVIAQILGTDKAHTIANTAEYTWNTDPSNDPFAID